jgi:hypothetical protein
MTVEIVKSSKGELSQCRVEGGDRIAQVSDFLDAMANCPTSTIVMNKESLSEDFFDLKSGLVGECLQKISNYRKRLIIVGDFREIASKPLKDFIYESNGTGKVIFASDIETGVELLK